MFFFITIYTIHINKNNRINWQIKYKIFEEDIDKNKNLKVNIKENKNIEIIYYFAFHS